MEEVKQHAWFQYQLPPGALKMNEWYISSPGPYPGEVRSLTCQRFGSLGLARPRCRVGGRMSVLCKPEAALSQGLLLAISSVHLSIPVAGLHSQARCTPCRTPGMLTHNAHFACADSSARADRGPGEHDRRRSSEPGTGRRRGHVGAAANRCTPAASPVRPAAFCTVCSSCSESAQLRPRVSLALWASH